MKSPAAVFDHEARQRMAQAIGEAEAQTSAEIVPVAASASGRYDRAEDIVGLWFGGGALAVAWWLYPLPKDTAPGDWSAAAPVWQLIVLLAALVFGFVVGAAVGSRVGWLRRLFTHRAEMHEEVFGRARQIFFDNRVHHTESSTGVLVYLSLYERVAAIVADQAVLDSLGQQTLDELCLDFVQRLRAANPTDAFCQVIAELGERLGAVLPCADDDKNELSDALVLLD